jgi:hypothetical protein
MLTSTSVKSLYSKLQNAQGRLASVKEKAEATLGVVLTGAEMTGSAFGMTYSNERFGNGELKVMGVPVDLSAGLLLHMGGLLGGLGKYSEHGHAIANGLLASFACRKAATMGAHARTSSGFQPAAAFAGFQPAAAFAGFQPAAAYAGFQPAAAYGR